MTTLQEEYYQRHKLKDVPVMNYVTNGTLLLKPDGSFGGYKRAYILMSIRWKETQNHPGLFHFNYYVPVNEGHMKHKFFMALTDKEMKLDWDEYLGYMTHWSRTTTMRPIIDEKEVKVAAWEIFLFCMDEWFTAQSTARPDFMRMIWRSVDADTSLDARIEAQKDCLGYLHNEFPSVVKSFNYEIMSSLENYCYWLGKLIYWQKGNLPICIDPTSNIL